MALPNSIAYHRNKREENQWPCQLDEGGRVRKRPRRSLQERKTFMLRGGLVNGVPITTRGSKRGSCLFG
jgi:hypothetical protein